MKKLLLVLLCMLSLNILAQNEKITIEEFFIDIEQKLLYQEIVNVDNKSAKEIITLVKNWSSITFVNSEAVIVSETDNQIVLNYIDNSFYVNSIVRYNYPWYIRIVVQFKDNKLRISFYDDGNTYMPGYYSGSYYVKPVLARSRGMQSFFFQ